MVSSAPRSPSVIGRALMPRFCRWPWFNSRSCGGLSDRFADPIWLNVDRMIVWLIRLIIDRKMTAARCPAAPGAAFLKTARSVGDWLPFKATDSEQRAWVHRTILRLHSPIDWTANTGPANGLHCLSLFLSVCLSVSVCLIGSVCLSLWIVSVRLVLSLSKRLPLRRSSFRSLSLCILVFIYRLDSVSGCLPLCL